MISKAAWGVLKAWERNSLVSSRVFGVKVGCLEEAGTPVLYWFNEDGHQEVLPRFTTDRNACALVLDAITNRSDLTPARFVHELGDALCSPGTAHHQSDDGVSMIMHYSILDVLRADPDTICYCAVKAVEDGG